MTARILSLTDRQPEDVRLRALIACERQERARNRPATLDQVMGHSIDRGIVLHASLDAWYRSLPIQPGRLGPKITMISDLKRHYGLPGSARLLELRGLGGDADYWRIVNVPVLGGRAVGVKAPMGGGVGVLWSVPRKANEYALRLHVEQGFPIMETDA